MCDMYKIKLSMGRTGVCYDNAGAESFFATIKRELIDRYFWSDPKNLRSAITNGLRPGTIGVDST